MSSIINEKVAQAVDILEELQVDAWLTFVRETAEGGDPVLPLILGQSLTWQSALIVTRSGERIAIVGKYEDEAVRASGVWTEVVPYVESVRGPLVENLKRIDPSAIAVNFSKDDVKADGLSHGMFMLLQDYLSDTPYSDRLVSADGIIGALRGRKTAVEIERIRAAIKSTEEIFEAVAEYSRPGVTEQAIAQFVKEQTKQRGLSLAWESGICPVVNTGPDSMIGHGIPSTLEIEPGHVLHMDFGVCHDNYCADLQRCWYVPGPGETQPPDAVCRAFDTVVAA
ncbi:MAG: M24 family metallopeptidase, partial [Planctomycetota bacterium]